MSTFRELLELVKDDKLPLPMIERYRDELVHLHSAMQLELSEIEKEAAFFFVKERSEKHSDVSIKREWRATERGQREITLNRYIKACVKEVDSLKSRIYSQL